MGEKAIRVAGLGKEYQIGTRERGYTTFREALARAVTAPLRRLRRLSGVAEQGGSFWALKDVSFEVEPGEVVGIIGRNGAGKSTLLKVLSQITEPTIGEITLNGRVGSLLEVGTGFHPELTGRENIYLNGAILGMSRREVARKFDEIVAFSEVEQFLDTPVKRYSSGMYTRLAFAVAAHLEPEILIVDEVLAVGDAQFQQKCIGKMSEVAKGGRTVLFVSHNMAAVEALCDRGVLLESGAVRFAGAAPDAVRLYLGTGTAAAWYRTEAPRTSGPHIVEAGLRTGNGRVRTGEELEFVATVETGGQLLHPELAFGINNSAGTRIATLHTKCASADQVPASWGGRLTFTCKAPDLLLVPGEYSVKVEIASGGQSVEAVQAAFAFTVDPTDFFGNGGKRVGGVVYCRQAWTAIGA